MDCPRDQLGRKKRKCKARDTPFTLYNDQEFTAKYRLSKEVVRELVNDYKHFSRFKGSRRGGGLSHLDRMCLVLRYFATGSFYCLTGDSQKVSRSAVCRAVKDVSRYFFSQRHKYIQWPNSFEAKMQLALKLYRHKVKKRDGSEEEQKTPFVFGYVDGTHIPIKTPIENESVYVNRNGYHSINTTVICDYDRRILYVDPRWPGSVHDAYALNASPVGDELEAEKWGEFVLLADSGYGLRRNLFTPYKDEVAPKKAAFNKWHRKSRVRVEQTIGVLKQRWRILDSSAGYVRHEPQRASHIITSCACLHNIALDHGIRLVDQHLDPWTPVRLPLLQPTQRTRREESERIKKYRDEYCDNNF